MKGTGVDFARLVVVLRAATASGMKSLALRAALVEQRRNTSRAPSCAAGGWG